MPIYEHVCTYQVLQRDFETNTAQVKKANGDIVTLRAGGPYTIDGAKNVYVGDIWVMAGQSNMRGHAFYNDPFTGESYIPEPIPSVHLFQSNETWAIATEPTHRLHESPRRVHKTLPDPTVRNPQILESRGVSLGLFFAKAYQEKNDNVPLGLVASAHGGTSIEQWNEYQWIREDVEDAYQDTLYGAMLGRIKKVGGHVAGVLWYQGETDGCSEDNDLYAAGMMQLFEAMRRDIHPNLPIVCAQIGRLVSNDVDDWRWSTVAELQLRDCEQEGPFTAAVASVDCELDDKIHLSAHGLKTVGYRMAVGATLARIGKGQEASPKVDRIVYEETNQSGVVVRSLKVTFKYLDRWKLVDKVYGFSLRDRAKNYGEASFIYASRIEEDDQSVRLLLSPQIEAIREHLDKLVVWYGYGKNPVCNLTTISGMALLTGPYEAEWRTTSVS